MPRDKALSLTKPSAAPSASDRRGSKSGRSASPHRESSSSSGPMSSGAPPSRESDALASFSCYDYESNTNIGCRLTSSGGQLRVSTPSLVRSPSEVRTSTGGGTLLSGSGGTVSVGSSTRMFASPTLPPRTPSCQQPSEWDEGDNLYGDSSPYGPVVLPNYSRNGAHSGVTPSCVSPPSRPPYYRGGVSRGDTLERAAPACASQGLAAANRSRGLFALAHGFPWRGGLPCRRCTPGGVAPHYGGPYHSPPYPYPSYGAGWGVVPGLASPSRRGFAGQPLSARGRTSATSTVTASGGDDAPHQADASVHGPTGGQFDFYSVETDSCQPASESADSGDYDVGVKVDDPAGLSASSLLEVLSHFLSLCSSLRGRVSLCL